MSSTLTYLKTRERRQYSTHVALKIEGVWLKGYLNVFSVKLTFCFFLSSTIIIDFLPVQQLTQIMRRSCSTAHNAAFTSSQPLLFQCRCGLWQLCIDIMVTYYYYYYYYYYYLYRYIYIYIYISFKPYLQILSNFYTL